MAFVGKMVQVYHDYLLWEDYKNGMYDISQKENESELINNAISLLSNENEFYNVCINVITNWEICTSVNLTNVYCNRRAWLGQSACNYKYGVPEILTRVAWGKLDNTTQLKANNVADKIIRIYETKNKEIYSGLGTKMLF
jgi:hypothetical protein